MRTATIRTYADADAGGIPLLTYVLEAPEVDDLDERDTVAVAYTDLENPDVSAVLADLTDHLATTYLGSAHDRATVLADALDAVSDWPTDDGATLEVSW